MHTAFARHTRFVSSTRLLSQRPQPRAGLFRLRTFFPAAALALFACTAALAQVRDYSSIVVFGDSLSDTGNDTYLSEARYSIPVPGPILPYEDYTLGSFTDGADTVPAARKYFYVWIKQLADSLPSQPPVIASLDGGTNYAYGYAKTGNGTSPLTFGPSNADSIQVVNIGEQITQYLATNPKIDDHTLFVVWGGAVDLLNATSTQDVTNAAFQQLLNLQRLVEAGATQFLVPNLPPLGLTPLLNSSPSTSLPASAASLLFNSIVATGIDVLKDFYPLRHLTFYQLDVFNLMLRIDASPSSYGLTNVTVPAEELPVDPDTYLFWDDIHPTTRGHNILATAAYDLLSQ
jgi:phospholipase/lecithinase/hemolysin